MDRRSETLLFLCFVSFTERGAFYLSVEFVLGASFCSVITMGFWRAFAFVLVHVFLVGPVTCGRDPRVSSLLQQHSSLLSDAVHMFVQNDLFGLVGVRMDVPAAKVSGDG